MPPLAGWSRQWYTQRESWLRPSEARPRLENGHMAITGSVVQAAGSSTVPLPTIDQVGQSRFPREWTLADLHERLGELLDGAAVLPGFALELRQLLVELDRPSQAE